MQPMIPCRQRLPIKRAGISLAVVLVVTVAGCRFMPFCIDCDSYSPEDLLELHQYVLIGRVESIDTIAYLGRVAYFGEEEDYLVLQYVLSPKEVFKGKEGEAYVKLWYAAGHRVRDGRWFAPDMKLGDLSLVYGNEIQNGETRIDLLEPTIYSSVESIRALMAGDTTGRPNDNSREADSALALLVLQSGQLQSALEDRESVCPVIHATDQSMHTSWEYSREHIAYCDRDLQIGFMVTSEEYLEKLRDLATN